MSIKHFDLGRLVATRNVVDRMENQSAFREFVYKSLFRYRSNDWGDLNKEDRASNDYAIDHNERILAVYKDNNLDVTIWIITEWDRSVTTILFPIEY